MKDNPSLKDMYEKPYNSKNILYNDVKFLFEGIIRKGSKILFELTIVIINLKYLKLNFNKIL
jgi:hypothetical protein